MLCDVERGTHQHNQATLFHTLLSHKAICEDAVYNRSTLKVRSEVEVRCYVTDSITPSLRFRPQSHHAYVHQSHRVFLGTDNSRILDSGVIGYVAHFCWSFHLMAKETAKR